MNCSGSRDVSHIIKFNRTNFPLCKVGLFVSLEEQEMLTIVHGTTRIPDEVTSIHKIKRCILRLVPNSDESEPGQLVLTNGPEISEWKKKDVLKRRLFLSTIDPNLQNTFLDCKTANEILVMRTSQHLKNAAENKYVWSQVAMAEEGASSRNATRVRLHGTNIKITVPLPNILKCGEKTCQAGRHAKTCTESLSSSILHQSLELTIASAMDGSHGSPNSAHYSFPTFSPSRKEGDKLILKYPGKPTKCPRCEWNTLATNTRAISSIHRHLETAHTLRLVKYWECGVCGFAGDGPTLKGHYQRLHSNHSPSPSIRFAWISSMDGSNRDSSATVISLEEVAATEDERELSVVEIPAIEEYSGNAISSALFTASPILDLGRRRPRTCTADWLPKAQILQDPSSEQPRGNPDKRKRNQNRQMQKAQRKIKQRVLEDHSPSYDDTVQAAEEYLKRTYNRLRPYPQQGHCARELYDTCDWSQPSEDQMNFLNRAPTQQELEAKLRWATKTSSGVSGLECRHLRAMSTLTAFCWKQFVK
ncbi:Uncharacterized protein APZ42_031135 [Daphnia magna]|uniref:Uncharacterized protein n=1 Tax=Daphnia magna TaxID=35525 RepID=A0A162DC48_9CRUS|nr:Uncharacterized protein APZ42_031135 [Daphnia magna]